MKLETMLKALLLVLVVCLAVAVTSWIASDLSPARAQGGGGSALGTWMMVASELHPGEGLLYMFNVEKEVLLVYSYNRGWARVARNPFSGDLVFLAGRHCKWDLLYAQLQPYPYDRANPPPQGVDMPATIKQKFDAASAAPR